MKPKLICLLFLLAMFGASRLAHSMNYYYFSDSENNPNGDTLMFAAGDTLWGMVRSNDTITIAQNPVFFDTIITCAGSFRQGPDFNPTLNGPDPIFNAPHVTLPRFALTQRDSAIDQGHFFEVYYPVKARVVLEDHNLHITWGILGTPFDTLSINIEDHPIENSSVVYFNCPIWLSGTCHTDLILCAAGNIYLADNVQYPTTNIETGIPAQWETARLALIAEENIIVLNTPANGRENSNGPGYEQTNQDSTSIVINAYLAALGGSFTFEQQNDSMNAYVYEASPDERGKIHLYGGCAVRYRDYLHRSNNGSTGYLRDWHWDPRVRTWDIGVFRPGPAIFTPIITPPNLDFGEVAIGTSAWDTVDVQVGPESSFSGVSASFGFYSPAGYLYGVELIHIPIRFTPEHTLVYIGEAFFYVNGVYYNIPLRGTGIVPPLEQPFTATVYPNPFNSAASLSLNLPTSGDLHVTLYDILGREVERLRFDHLSAGSQKVSLDLSNLASGAYFANTQIGSEAKTLKLLLMK